IPSTAAKRKQKMQWKLCKAVGNGGRTRKWGLPVVFRHIFAYAADVSEDRTNLALLVSASLIAAVRTARMDIKPTPAVTSAVSDSVRLAKMVLEKLRRDAATPSRSL